MSIKNMINLVMDIDNAEIVYTLLYKYETIGTEEFIDFLNRCINRNIVQ